MDVAAGDFDRFRSGLKEVGCARLNRQCHPLQPVEESQVRKEERLGPMPTCSSSSLVSTNPPAGSSKKTERGKD
jgi:hypothetical protein